MSAKFLLLFLALLFSASILQSQNKDLRHDQLFFQNRSKDYSSWLSDNELGRFFRIEKVDVVSQKVTLFLLAKFTGEKAGDSLRSVWKDLRRQYYHSNRQELHVAMLSKMAFQMELPLDSAEIILLVPGAKYSIRIYGEREEVRVTARWEDFGDKGMGSGTIIIPIGQLNDILRNGNTNLGEKTGLDLPHVRRVVRAFFLENYVNKHTDWLWKALIDSTSEVYNTFSYTITHISREVLKSHNFFELHQIDITIAEGTNGLEISWTFQAKYGGGLIFPPRDDSNDYHDFETSPYKEQFKKYQTMLFKRLEAHLKKV